MVNERNRQAVAESTMPLKLKASIFHLIHKVEVRDSIEKLLQSKKQTKQIITPNYLKEIWYEGWLLQAEEGKTEATKEKACRIFFSYLAKLERLLEPTENQ